MKIKLNENGDQVKIVAVPNGPDDNDFEEVLLSDSEKFDETVGAIVDPNIY